MADRQFVVQPGKYIKVQHRTGTKPVLQETVNVGAGERVVVVQAGYVPPEPTPEPEPEPVPPEPTPPPTTVWAAMPGWDAMGAAQFADMAQRGVSAVVVELNWASAQPTEGAFNASFFTSKLNEINTRRNQGFDIVLNYGLHHAPAWLTNKPGGKFINQHGAVYGGDEPNLIQAMPLRAFAQTYTNEVFARMGTDFVAVRTGGGHWGELQWPDDAGQNLYWSFAVTPPTGAWRPGQASPSGQAATFLTWHLNQVADYAKWQVTSVRQAGFNGPIAVLLASDGMRYAGEPGAFGATSDFDQAVAVNLNGTSPAERNGEVQPGFDHRRMLEAVATLPNKDKIAPWASYAESTGRGGPMKYIAGHGKRLGLYPVMAENSGNDTVPAHEYAVRTFRSLGGSVYVWVRGDTLYGTVNEMPTYERLINE